MGRKRNYCIGATCAVILLIAIIILAVEVSKNRKGHDDDNSSTNLTSTLCSTTQYPDVCLASMGNTSGSSLTMVARSVSAGIVSITDMLQSVNSLSLNETDENVIAALNDCKDTLEDSLEQMNDTVNQLTSLSLKNLEKQSQDIVTWMSAALTDQTTCMDGFDNLATDAKSQIEAKANASSKVLSNALSLVRSLTSLGDDLSKWKDIIPGRSLSSSEFDFAGRKLGDWLSEADRRILADSSDLASQANAIVPSSQYQTIQSAVDVAPLKSSKRWIVYIKKGTYLEQVIVSKKQINLMFVGDGMNQTVITGSRNVQQKGVTTFTSGTILVNGLGFIAKDLTIQNTAGAVNHQAVAIRVSADKTAFQRVAFEGYQDTVYTHSLRQFYKDCQVFGTIDFVFGNAAAIFQTCQIFARLPMSGQSNTLTAQGRTDKSQNTGLSFLSCTVDGVPDLIAAGSGVQTFLGRPWKQYSNTVFIKSTLGSLIDPQGWLPWSGDFALKTLFYGEYENEGPGAGAANRVSWSTQITSASVANKYSVPTFISGTQWLPATTVSYTTTI